MENVSIKTPFEIAALFLELAAISFFFHDAIIGVLKIKEIFFFYGIFVFALVGLIMGSYGLMKKTLDLFSK